MRTVYSLNRYGFNNRYVRRQAQCVCLTELCLGLQADLVVGAASRPFVLSVSVTLPVGFAAPAPQKAISREQARLLIITPRSKTHS